MLQHQDKKMKLKLLQHQTQSNSCNSPNQGRQQQCCLNQGNNASANIGMLLCYLKMYAELHNVNFTQIKISVQNLPQKHVNRN